MRPNLGNQRVRNLTQLERLKPPNVEPNDREPTIHTIGTSDDGPFPAADVVASDWGNKNLGVWREVFCSAIDNLPFAVESRCIDNSCRYT